MKNVTEEENSVHHLNPQQPRPIAVTSSIIDFVMCY